MHIRLFAIILTIISTCVQAQNDITTSVNGGQSNLLGNNIGQQSNQTTNNIAGGYGTSTSNSYASSDITTRVISVPTMYAPSLTTGGSDICLGSVSGAGSILGFGISGGKTYVDDNCVLLKNSQRMASLGFANTSIVMMMQNEQIAESIRISSPAVYLQVEKDKLANLQAEYEYLKQVGDSTQDIEKRISKANREVQIMALRVKASPSIPEKAVEITSETTSTGSPKKVADPREILK
jgi:glutamate synthase domain-containing protein 3